MQESFPTGQFRRQQIVTHSEHSSKTREIFIPDEHTMNIHDRTLAMLYEDEFLDTSSLPDNAWVNGGMPGAQLIEGVLPHKDNWTFYKLDIKNAFPSVDVATLWDEMKVRMKDYSRYEEMTMYVLLKHFMEKYAVTPDVPGLPLGAPCSPYLFNVYCLPMDRLLAEFCKERGLTYTRYLDDVTISSPKKDHTLGEDTRHTIREIIESRPGFSINHAKSRLLHREKSHITITGIALYPDGRIQPRPELIEKTLAVFNGIADEVFVGTTITPSHVGIVDGYHGVLKSMSTEPYNKMMKEAFREYRVVAGLVRAAIGRQEEVPYVKEDNTEKTAILEHMLIEVLNGNPRAISWVADEQPWLWKILLKNGVVNARPTTF